MLSLHVFDQKYSNIVKYYYNFKQRFSIWMHFKMLFIAVIKAECSVS